MVPTRPEMEFPRALEMKRHFILHVGPTNCGKTYQALQRLRTAYKGIYLGPLRLLALEVYEKMRESGVPCTMLTGEERIYEENSRVKMCIRDRHRCRYDGDFSADSCGKCARCEKMLYIITENI